MAEYIKRTDVMKICEGYSEHCFSSSDAKGQDIADRILDDVVEIPTADVEEVKHGEWVEIVKDIGRGRTITHYQCSLCGVYIAQRTNGCPNCIAKMDGGNEE